MYLTAYPRFASVSSYDLAIERMVEKLKQQDGVLSLFQIGNTNNPGISDIDMLVVFEDGAKCNLNPLEDISKTDRYLFSHGLYGISKTSFSQAHHYTFFHNYKLLWGEELPLGECDLSGEEIQVLKTQIALEYLIKMFVNSTIELTYGIMKVRGLLMHVKALLYDLEFLNVSSGRLFDLVQTIILWRDQWFEKMPDKQMLRQWFDEFYAELTVLLKVTLQKTRFYLPDWANFCIARNVTLVLSKKFDYSHKGITLPAILGGLGRKYFNVQHRFNTFEFQIPITTSEIPDRLFEQFSFIKNIRLERNRNLPYFMPFTSSLNMSLQMIAEVNNRV